MTLQQALTWVSVGQQLVSVGIATYANIQGWIKALHPGVSDADLNAILDAIVTGAARHQALANADAGKI